jgi:subtilisin family serine protease
MNWSDRTVIVSFRNRTKNIEAEEYLKRAEGFVRIKHAYRLTNSALVEVIPGMVNAFISDMKNYDDVEYCEYNYYVLPQAINEYIGSWSESSNWSCREVRDIHGLATAPLSGVNTKIAIIDSGISPHPYLPALSFSQSLSFIEQWPDDIKGIIPAERYIRRIASLESNRPYPLSSGATQPVCRRFQYRAEVDLLDFYRELWEAWLPNGVQWHQNTIPLYRAFLSQQSSNVFGGPSLPRYPMSRHAVCGLLRRISPDSWNYIDDKLDVEDSHGHGTHIAGIIAGRAGASLAESVASKKTTLEKYETDVMGVVPAAELMILKCFDQDKIKESNVDALIKALEHAHDHKADIVYCGLAFDPGPRGIPTKTAITLDRTIQILAQEDIPVVCPSGNQGKAELEFPAACSGAFAVTAITKDTNNQLALTSYSNYASPVEDVQFTAFGGEGSTKVITTDISFGFTRVTGTSVAAAIATGIIARFLSKKNTELRDKQYNDAMYKLLHSGVAPTLPMPFIDSPRVSLREIINEARLKTFSSLLPGAAPIRQAFGNGLIRQFL